jgi:hypothetical protein
VATLNATSTVLVFYRRVFKPGGNNPDPEALEPFTCTSFAQMSFEHSLRVVGQMRRAVKDYKYEVQESHMTEECIQYLAQLQKDWGRQRVKLGVEALRKEVMSSNATKIAP